MMIEIIVIATTASSVLTLLKNKLEKRELLADTEKNTAFSEYPMPTKRVLKNFSRRQQLQEISGKSETQISPKEKNINTNLIVATSALIVTGVGALFPSPWVLIALPAIFYNSIPHFKDAYRTIFKERRLGIGVLDSLIVIACVATGYFFAAAISNFFFYFSRKLLLKTENQSKKNLQNVFGELPSHVWVVRGKVEQEIPISLIKAGDIIVVGTGETIPVDGTIIEGYASIDQHMLTGESQPAEKEINEQVLSSTVVLSGKIFIRVEKAGSDTVVAKIGEILQQTVNFKSSFQSRGESIADKSATPILALGAVALPLVGVNRAVAVLNSNFGVNMRVIAPFATLSFLSIASKYGILIKDGRIFELLNKVDTIVFDKTGTLTVAQPHIGEIHVFGQYSKNELLAITASIEKRQSHPIAKAIVRDAKNKNLSLFEVSDSYYEIGYGLQVTMNNQTILVGSERFMKMKDIPLTEQLMDVLEHCHQKGHSLVMVAIDGHIAGAIELHVTIRSEAKEIIQTMKTKFAMKTFIISGDQEQPTKYLAEKLGIDHYYANTLPENKAVLVDELQKQGRSVCFIGDGINDSIALKQADVSVSLRGASTVATDTAQVILMDENLIHLTLLFELAQDYEKNIQRSFLMTLVPGAVNVLGAFFFSSGVIFSIILDRVGQFSGVANGVFPLFKGHYAKQLQQLNHQYPRDA